MMMALLSHGVHSHRIISHTMLLGHHATVVTSLLTPGCRGWRGSLTGRCCET